MGKGGTKCGELLHVCEGDRGIIYEANAIVRKQLLGRRLFEGFVRNGSASPD
jgi:hypothetical protein